MCRCKTMEGSLSSRRSGLIIATVSIVSAGMFALLGYLGSFAVALPTFLGACDRLRRSGLGPTPDDWFCRISESGTRLIAARSALLLGIGFGLTCLVLAASGRRWSAFLPLLGWLGIPHDSFPTIAVRFFERHPGVQSLLALALLAMPAIALIVFRHPRRRERMQAARLAMLVSALAFAGAAYFALDQMTAHNNFFGETWTAGAAISLGIFGALLGTDRRWWPWALAPAAFLLSEGPALALGLVDPNETIWTLFGWVVPLFVAGLICSAWEPLSVWLTWSARLRRPAPLRRRRLPTIDLKPRSGIRPTAALNMFATVILIVSSLMASSDPFRILVATPLPTYLGYRDQANDLRTRMDLDLAMSYMDDYYQAHHTYVGFNTRGAGAADFSLVWSEGPYRPQPPDMLTYGRPALVSATATEARVVELSGSGSAICIEHRRDRPGSGITYGTGSTTAGAIFDCGTKPWTATATKTLAPLECAADSPGYLICRMVQVLSKRIMTDSRDFSATFPPTPGHTRPALLPDGRPKFIVTHSDGSITVVDGISAHKPWGIGYLVSWCPSSRTFDDVAHGSVYNEFGEYLLGPAPTGLQTYPTRPDPEEPGMIQLGAAMPGAPRQKHPAPGLQGPFCTKEEDLKAAANGIRPLPLDLQKIGSGQWVSLEGNLVVQQHGPTVLCQPPPGSCDPPIPVEGVDTSILEASGRRRYEVGGLWLARILDGELTQLTLIRPP